MTELVGSNKDVARAISNLLSLPFVAAPVVIMLSFFSPEHFGALLTPIGNSVLGIALVVFAPIASILYLLAKKRTDVHASKEKRPPIFFAPPLAAYSFAAIVFEALKCRSLFVLSVAYLSITLIVFLVTFFWRISIHMAGLTGPITALILVFGLSYSPLYLLALPLGWARTELEAHSLLQVISGAIVGVVATTIVYVELI